MALQWPPVLFLEVTLVIEESEASSCASDVRCAVTEGDLAMMMGASTCAAMGAAESEQHAGAEAEPGKPAPLPQLPVTAGDESLAPAAERGQADEAGPSNNRKRCRL